MGAGAAKQYQSDKTRHAEKVFEAVRAYEAAHPDKYNNEYAHLQGFKTRVQLAAVEAKRKGKEIDSALAQLSDVDLETLRKFVEDSWRQKEEERKRKNENAANEAMTVEEFVEEDPNLNDNAQDETTSVLSYGDGEEGQGEVESDGEIDSSHSLLLGKSKSRDDGDIGESSGEIVEDLELQNDHSVDHGRGAAVKIFPMDAVTDMAGLGYTTPNRKAPNKQQVTVRVDEAKDVGIANALAKFWEIDEVGSIQSQLNLGADSPRAGSFSPFSPDLRSSRRSLESMATRERNKNLDERNERLMGLQRQKVISFTQNAQLEREVEALQRQLERMEELDRVAGIPSGTSSSSVFQAGTPVRLHNSMQSSASTIYNSANNTPIQSTNTSNSLLSNQRSNQSNNHQPSKLSYIYPIDEETNDWNNSLMNTPDAKLVPNQLKPQQRGYYQMARDKKNSITSSSSSDEEPNATKQNNSYGIQQRLKQPVQPSISNNNNVTNGNSSAQSKSKVQSSVSSNRQAGGGRNTRSEDKLNSSPSASSLNNAPASSSQFHFNNMVVADGKNTSNTTTPQNQDKYSSLAGNMSDVSSSSHVKNSNNRGGRRTRYRTNSNAGDDSDDSTSNNNSKAIFSTPNNNSSNKLFNPGERRANANNSNANNGMNSNYASDSDTNTNNQVMPLSARGAGGKSISTNNVVNTNSGKKLSTSGTSNAGAGAKMVPSNNSNNNNPTTTATSSSTSLDPSVLNNLNSSPQGHSPLSKRHAEARRARNTIQTESDHKMSPGHSSSNNMNNNSNIPQPTGLNRRGISNKNNNNHNDYSEDEQSAAGSKGPSKNTALKRLNKRRHSADGLTDLNTNNGHNNNNPQLTPADESQIKALLEKQISDLSQQSPISLHALGKKISNSNNNNRNDGFMDAKRVASLDQADKPNNRQKKHPGALLNPAEHIDDELTQFAKRPSNAPNARQQGSGMLFDHDFDALFAAVDMVPGAELSPGQRQQEVFRHNQTDSSVMSAALATGSQQLPDVSLLNTSTTTNSEDNTGQPLNGHHGHHHGHHGRHHHHHGHHHHHKQQPQQSQQQQQENSNRMMNVEDISPTQTQNKMPPVNNNPGGDVDAITSMASAAAVVNNIQNLKKKGNKASRHHSVSTRQSVGSNNANTNQSNAATEDTAASGVDKNWSDELDHAWAEVSFILRKPIKTEEDMMYTVAAAEAGIIFTDQMNTYAKTLQVLRGALSRWLLPYDNNTRIETQCSTPHSVVENMPDEFRGKLTERQVHYLVAGANEVRKLVRIKIADDNDLEQARQALKTTDAFFKKLYMRAKQLEMSPFDLLKKSGTF